MIVAAPLANLVIRRLGHNADRQEVGRRLNNPRGEIASAVSTTRTGHAAISNMRTLQKFSSVHAEVHNHFNQERHLVTREVLPA